MFLLINDVDIKSYYIYLFLYITRNWIFRFISYSIVKIFTYWSIFFIFNIISRLTYIFCKVIYVLFTISQISLSKITKNKIVGRSDITIFQLLQKIVFQQLNIKVTITFTRINKVGDKFLNLSQIKVLAEIRNNPNARKQQLSKECNLRKNLLIIL